MAYISPEAVMAEYERKSTPMRETTFSETTEGACAPVRVVTGATCWRQRYKEPEPVTTWADLVARHGQDDVLGQECEREAKAGAELIRYQRRVEELEATRKRIDVCREKDRTLILDLLAQLKVMTESRDCWVRTHTVAAQNWAKELARMAGLVLGRVEEQEQEQVEPPEWPGRIAKRKGFQI